MGCGRPDSGGGNHPLTADWGPEWRLGLSNSRAWRREIHPNLNCCTDSYLTALLGESARCKYDHSLQDRHPTVSQAPKLGNDHSHSDRQRLVCHWSAFFGTRGRRRRPALNARRTRNAAPAASRPSLVAGSLLRPASSLPHSGHRESRVRTDIPQLRHVTAGGRGRRPTTRKVKNRPNGPSKKPTQNHNQNRLPWFVASIPVITPNTKSIIKIMS